MGNLEQDWRQLRVSLLQFADALLTSWPLSWFAAFPPRLLYVFAFDFAFAGAFCAATGELDGVHVFAEVASVIFGFVIALNVRLWEDG